MQLNENESRLRRLLADKAVLMSAKLDRARVSTMTAEEYFKLAHDFKVQAEELVVMAKQFEQEAVQHYGRADSNDPAANPLD